MAVQLPVTATLTVAPAAIGAVLVLSVVPPTTRRVTVVTPTAVFPRFFTATLNVTAAPTAGFDGLELMLRTCRSGPGASATTSGDAAVRELLSSFSSKTVLSASTVALTG